MLASEPFESQEASQISSRRSERQIFCLCDGEVVQFSTPTLPAARHVLSYLMLTLARQYLGID